MIEVDAAALAGAIREQTALPITTEEADRLARALETSTNDEELLTNTMSALRFLVDQFEHAAPETARPTKPAS